MPGQRTRRSAPSMKPRAFGPFRTEQPKAESSADYFSLNMLQGTSFFPSLREAILFLEHPANGKATLMELDGGLRSLSFLPEFSEVRAIVIGRYARSAGVTREKLAALVGGIPALRHLPVIGNCDFGHTAPVLTLPIGGRCKLKGSEGKTSITLTEH